MLGGDSLATEVDTMERTCSMLDERLAAMHAAESALQSRGSSTAQATSLARHAKARMHHLHGESSALQHHCSTLQGHIQQLGHSPVAASPAAPSPPPPMMPPPPLPPQFGELWSHAAAADALALERLSGSRLNGATPREQGLISELSKKSQQAWHEETSLLYPGGRW